MAMPSLRLAASLLAPPRCGICAAPADPAAPICAPCERELASGRAATVAVAGVGEVVAALPYRGAARELVGALKFGANLGLARVAAAAIAAAIRAPLDGFAAVAVPPSPLRLRMRGFDPADEIASAVAARLELEREAPLARAHGPRQVGRRRVERLRSPPRVRALGASPARVLLIDDVLTTGATLAACAAALRRAGCAELRTAVFARALGAADLEA